MVKGTQVNETVIKKLYFDVIDTKIKMKSPYLIYIDFLIDGVKGLR